MKATIVLGGNMYDDSSIEHFLRDAAAIGYEGVEIYGGFLTVESVSKQGSDLPVHGELARQCYNDVRHLLRIAGERSNVSVK